MREEEFEMEKCSLQNTMVKRERKKSWQLMDSIEVPRHDDAIPLASFSPLLKLE